MSTPLPITVSCEVCREDIESVEDARFEGDTEEYGYVHASCLVPSHLDFVRKWAVVRGALLFVSAFVVMFCVLSVGLWLGSL